MLLPWGVRTPQLAKEKDGLPLIQGNAAALAFASSSKQRQEQQQQQEIQLVLLLAQA